MVDEVALLPSIVQPVNEPISRATTQPVSPSHGPAFEDLLKTQLGRTPSVRFSTHAQRRLESRQIDFGTEETRRLEEAVERAADKGARESLILMDDLALVVSVKNRVVITAVDGESRKENVFTNIDTVVLT